MLLDMLAAVARKDYDDRRRQAQGQARAKAAGLYKSRPEDAERNDGIGPHDCRQAVVEQHNSRATFAKIAKRVRGGQLGRLVGAGMSLPPTPTVCTSTAWQFEHRKVRRPAAAQPSSGASDIGQALH